MRMKFFLGLIVVLSLALLAADKFTPLNIKLGLWETTITHSTSGMPGIPEDTLAKMPPEQRARMEEMMKQKGIGGGPSTTITKNCITREKLDKQTAFAENRENCKRTVLSSSPSRWEMKFHCEENKTTSDGTVVAEAVTPDSTKGSTHVVTNSEGRTMTMDFKFTSRYLGAACGDVK